ncbi:tryptophan halogenase family protein [Microbulbifer sp.]|uniref:tryptophan halogenase family protein n=1 Tax=Microbulbifer sp. TaxID=1908541 RepID=UPI003F3714A4
MQNKIKNIVIVGGGTAGWMTAAALSRAMGTQLYNITLVESEQIGTVGVGEATIPLIKFFNNMLGLDEDEFVRETKATFKLGIEFKDWKTHNHSYFHPFGNIGVNMKGVNFMHFWLRWRAQGGKLDFLAFNAESAAAEAKRFMRVGAQPGPKLLPDINYAYHFDATLYAAYLRRYAEQRGTQRIEGKIVNVTQHPDSGYIESLQLDNGQTVAGDLFIDCSGFKGLLIEEVYKTGYTDWSHWLPVNSAAAVPSENTGDLFPYTLTTAREEGWQWRIPLQHRTGNGYVYCDHYISDDEAASKLLNNLDGKPLAEPRTLKFTTGIRNKFWVKNCVAIGLSSGFLEPLESTSIHLIQRAIFQLLELFPKNEISDLLSNRFNHEMQTEYVETKDFLIAHYAVTEREDTPFWHYVKNMELPDSLKEKLEMFRLRGEVMADKDAFFNEVSWFSVLFGQGLRPEGYHPVADTLSEDELSTRLTKVRAGVQKRVEMMPSHSTYLRSGKLKASDLS